MDPLPEPDTLSQQQEKKAIPRMRSCAVRTRGFTILELLISISIVGILSSLALTAFSIYRLDADEAVAKTVIRNARTALEANADSRAAVMGVSDPATGNMPAAMADALPGLTIPAGTMLRVGVFNCGIADQYMIALWSYGCLSDRMVLWIRTCAATEWLLPPIAAPGNC